MKDIIRPAVILLLITAVSGALLGMVSEVTKGPIAVQEEKTRSEGMKEVAPDADEFKLDEEAQKKIENKEYGENSTISSVYISYKGGEQIGYVITVNPSGFGGAVGTMVGISMDQSITGLKVLMGHSETPGLGAKSTDPSFSEQYVGKSSFPLSVIKSGTPGDNEIAAITSATITSTAVTDGANEAYEWFINNGGAK